VDVHTFTKQAGNVETDICQEADGIRFLEKERSANGGINATRDNSNVRNVSQNAERTV
jgi:hypothetical protein